MKELVLTGFEEFWPNNEEKAIFLGPWCFSNNSRYKFWDQDKFHIAPSPWNSASDLLEGSNYICLLIDRLSSTLTTFFNQATNSQRSQQYWKIRYIVWLYRFLGIAYDRYRRLRFFHDTNEEAFEIKTFSSFSCSFSTWTDFVEKFTEHPFNLFLMTEILLYGNFPKFEISRQNGFLEQKKSPSKFRMLQKLSHQLGVIREKLIKKVNPHFFLGTISGLTTFEKIIFSIRSFWGTRPDFFLSLEGCINSRRRDEVKDSLSPKNEFEEIILRIIRKFIPDSLFQLKSINGEQKSRPGIWIGNDIYDDQKAALIADWVERGGMWISSQHGGNYGTCFSFPPGKVEYDTSDGFISWGWNFPHNFQGNILPLPSPSLSKLKKHGTPSEKIIFISTCHPPYQYCLHSNLSSEQQLKYLNMKQDFFFSLNPEIRERVFYRPYLSDYGIGEIEFVRKFLAANQILIGGKLTVEMESSKLVIIDHVATTLLEALVMNVPVILFWEPTHFVLTPQAEPYFESLREAGILFDNPSDAAKKVSQVWNQIDSWWQEDKIQQTRKVFCRTFAWNTPNWRGEWLSFLKKLAKGLFQENQFK